MILTANVDINIPASTTTKRCATDPILLELWEIKRQLNQEANFDIEQLAKQANAFDLKKTMHELHLAIAH